MREAAPSSGAADIGTAIGVAKSLDGVAPERTSASDHGTTPFRPTIFRADSVEIDPQLGCVRRDGVEQPLRQQSFHVLLFLLARRFELVHKQELVVNFWHDAAVTDNALVQCIADIRRALGDDPRNPRFIKTVPRVGYRFIADIDEIWPERLVADPESLHAPAPTEEPAAESEGGRGSHPQAGQSFGPSRSPKVSSRRLVWAMSGLVALGAFAFGLLYLRGRRFDFATRQATLPPAMTRNRDAYEAYSNAVGKARGFQNAEAIALLEKATRLDPEFAMAYAQMGYAYAVTGFQPDLGKPYLEKAIQLSDRLSKKDQLYVRAWYAIASEDFVAAIRTLREVTAAFPLETEAYARLGRLLYREERPEEALAAVHQGLAVQPEDGDLYNVLGGCFLGLHRYPDAIAAHGRYVELAPREPNSHDSLGMSYQQAGKFPEAAKEFQRALELDPGFEPTLIHLGDLRAQEGRYRDAIQQYEHYIHLAQGDRPRAVAFGDLAEVYRRQGNSERAERAAAEEIKLSKSAVWDSLLSAMEHSDVAKTALLREQLFADEPYPERGVRHEMRTRAYYEGTLALHEGESQRAILLFAEALKHLPPVSGLDLHEDCLANAYLQLGRLDDAIGEYQRILSLNPNYPLAEYHLAEAYRGKGKRTQARAAYLRFLNQWQNADPDVQEVVDAKKAVSNL